jgi:hypothetical protein
MSLMPPKERFLAAARASDWKRAYDECNGLNMVDMLDCLHEIGPDLLRAMRAQMASYDVWGGPNMPRIRFAMDVVENRTVPAPPADLPNDQVQNARDFLARAALIANIRTSIVTLARSFVATAHYLWGTAGNQPGVPNGNSGGGKINAAQMRSFGINRGETDRDKVLAVCTAVQSHFDGYNTCAGRSGRYAEKPDLTTFLDGCRKEVDKGNTDQTTWQGAGSQNRLFPRKYYFKDAPKEEVWGESCDKIRHFDCVGLVNYCYARHFYKPGFGFDIAKYRDPVVGTQRISNKADLMDADILIKPDNSHIAMLYQKGGSWLVVQAASTTSGLTDTEQFNADPAAWDRFRMQGAFLRGLHS